MSWPWPWAGVNVFDNPARQSFISEMVSTRDLPQRGDA